MAGLKERLSKGKENKMDFISQFLNKELFSKLMNDVFTGKDNLTIDAGRVLWVCMVIAYILLEAADVAMTGTFESKDWAIGGGVLLFGGSAGVAIKKSAEPE
jgi:uncharacterized MAPEG superfamily protein